MVKNHKVERKERLMVDLTLDFPSLHEHKSYVDNRRYYQIRVDAGETTRIDSEGLVTIKSRLRALVVIKRFFGKKIDSSMTYRVGENFATLRINKSLLKISMSFNEANILKVLDNSSHIMQSRILEVTTVED